ncbi:MAG TPA: MauE/DoxX family redox-associated membrane protein [Flavobacterium sp.]|uniref:MauE/DoxX family redox-associated membrane protein n=1 Tax=Flavobacterium sp. TaxID=239 RepID=UPI002D13823F|nr:MauE/DoxX family redox-associated membrane protein [Flavobacterium sp.]HSD14266.1 MauE/DoxX family redox-associated membrane protein [Flavobacterium sp.]
MKYASTAIRILIAILFIISAVAKMYPSPYFAISTFEVKQLYPLGFSEMIAPWFSRILIGIELALGILILQNNYLKRLIIPATILLLVVFIGHLSYQTFLSGGNTGNCGCFGELLPMTPIEAIIKNIVAVVLLAWLYKLTDDDAPTSKFWVVGLITILTILGIFLLAPIKKTTSYDVIEPVTTIGTLETSTDSTSIPAEENNLPITKTDSVKENTTKKETEKVVEKAPVNEPAKRKSGYAKYFSDIDKGRKTLCFFVPGCDHCMEAAKELTEMKRKDPNFPEIKIIFMNEEPEKIPDFFKFAGAQYPYVMIDVIPFWGVLGSGKDTPGVKYLWNGNEYKFYYGTTDNKFNPTEYQTIINKTYSELKK